jgi:hypothetical protein
VAGESRKFPPLSYYLHNPILAVCLCFLCEDGRDMQESPQHIFWFYDIIIIHRSKPMRYRTKNVSYHAQLCPSIVMGQSAPDAPATQQIIDRQKRAKVQLPRLSNL